MFAAAYNTVSDIEIVWVFVSIFGFLYSMFNLRESHMDCEALRSQKIKNGRYLIARTSRYQDAVRSCIHMIFLTIGVLAMFLPETSPNADLPLTTELIGVAIRWGLIVAAIMLVSQSFVARQTRMKLLKEEIAYIENKSKLSSSM